MMSFFGRSTSPDDRDAPPPSRRRSSSPTPNARLVEVPKVVDVDPVRRAERERQLASRLAAMELEKLEKEKGRDGDREKGKQKETEFDPKTEFAKLTNTRSGGVYMPPARLRALQEAASKDKASAEYQRLSWDALRKSITGIVNRVNVTNIKMVVPELFQENLIRGRGLFSRSIMKAQAASLPFTPVFAALVSILNTKLPQVGELLLIRLISQFRRSFKRNDKVCTSLMNLALCVTHGITIDRVSLNNNFPRASRQSRRCSRDYRTPNPLPSTRKAHGRLYRNCRRLHARSRSIPFRKFSQSQWIRV